MAEIPVSTKNMQSAIVQVLSLVCSLLMISSHSGPAVTNCGSLLQGSAVLPGWPAGQHNDTSNRGGQPQGAYAEASGIHRSRSDVPDRVGRAPSPADLEVDSWFGEFEVGVAD